MKLTKKHTQEEYMDEDGYWIYLKPGFKSDMDPIGAVHIVHEDTRAEAMKEGVMRCTCEDCTAEMTRIKTKSKS